MSRQCSRQNDIAAGLRTFGVPYLSKDDMSPADLRFGNRRFASNRTAMNAFDFRRSSEASCGLDVFDANHAADFSQVETSMSLMNTMPGHCAARTPSQYFDLYVQNPTVMRGSVPTTGTTQNPKFIPTALVDSLGIRGESPSLQKLVNKAKYWQTINK